MLSPSLFCLSINQLAEHIQRAGKHGVQMLSGLIELFILLFADDVTILATTPSGLQNQLNCLRDCCVKMDMEVNEAKTKVMVFRNGGHLGKHEKWYYAGKSMKCDQQLYIFGFYFYNKVKLQRRNFRLCSKRQEGSFPLM